MSTPTAAPVPCTQIWTDTETTSLVRPYRPGGRRIWEIAVIRRETDRTERRLHLFIRLADLDLIEQLPAELQGEQSLGWAERLQLLPRLTLQSLNIGDFFHRHPDIAPGAPGLVVSQAQAADMLMDGWLTPDPGAEAPWLFGVVPSFEDMGYEDLLHRTGYGQMSMPYYYGLQDVTTYAAGRLGLMPPWESDGVSRMLGLRPEHYPRHTAMGDAEWAKDMLDVAILDAVSGPDAAARAELFGGRPEMSSPPPSVGGA